MIYRDRSLRSSSNGEFGESEHLNGWIGALRVMGVCFVLACSDEERAKYEGERLVHLSEKRTETSDIPIPR